MDSSQVVGEILNYGVLGVIALLFLWQYKADIEERKIDRKDWQEERKKAQEKTDMLQERIAEMVSQTSKIIDANSEFIRSSSTRHDDLDKAQLEANSMILDILEKADTSEERIAKLEEQIKQNYLVVKRQEFTSKRESHYAKEQLKVSLALYKSITGAEFQIKEYVTSENVEI